MTIPALPHSHAAGLIVVLVALALYLAAPALVRRSLGHTRADANILTLARHLLRFIVVVLALMVVPAQFGVVAPSVFGAAFFGLALGSAAGSLLGATLNGFYLLLEDRIRVGQVISVDDKYTGRVADIQLRFTELLDVEDGSAIIVSNVDLFTKPVKMLSDTAVQALHAPDVK